MRLISYAKNIQTCIFKIAGVSNPNNPNYLTDLFSAYEGNLQNVEYFGYVDDFDIPTIFANSNVVVMTNETSAGSSGVLRLASNYGKPIVAPYLQEYIFCASNGWGIVYFDINSSESLANSIFKIFKKPEYEDYLGKKNFDKAKQNIGEFLQAHSKIFLELYSGGTKNYGLVNNLEDGAK